MGKWSLLLLLLIILSSYSYALDTQDLGNIEQIVDTSIREENEKLRNDLNDDIEVIKKEINSILEDLEGSQAKSKIILVLTLSSTIVISQTLISFLQFLIWKKKRKLEPIKDSKNLEELDNMKKEMKELKEENKKFKWLMTRKKYGNSK